jgi:hypothetical protein
MYEVIFTNNFILNFLTSFLFINLNFFFSYCIFKKINIQKKLLLDSYQPLIFFFLILAVISTIFNVLIIINGHAYFREVLILIIITELVYIFTNFSSLKINFCYHPKFNKIYSPKFDKIKYLIFFLLFAFYSISILPISDADSIALHQNLPNKIFLKGFNNFNLERNLDFTIFSNSHSLLIISPSLNSDNFGAQLNILTLIYFIFLNFKNNKNFTLILFSCPLIIYLISVQKLSLLFGILYLLIFIQIHKKKIQNKFDLFVIIFLITFYSSGNASYILFSIPLFLYVLIKKKECWKKITIYSTLSFVIILFPLFLIKQIYFGNIFAPFLDNFFGQNNFLYNAYSYSIRSTDGWLLNPSNYKLYLVPFIPFDLSSLTTSLGIIFLIMLLNIKLNRETKFFPFIIIFSVLFTGQIIPRYYLEAFLILSYYYTPKSFIPKITITLQIFFTIIMSMGFIYFAYIKNNVIKGKEEYMRKYSFTYFNSLEYKKISLKENILNLVEPRDSIFFADNIFSFRTINIIDVFNKSVSKNSEIRNDYLNKFILNNSIEFIITKHKEDLPNCLTTTKIKDINYKLAVRNYLIKDKFEQISVFKIKTNKCLINSGK